MKNNMYITFQALDCNSDIPWLPELMDHESEWIDINGKADKEAVKYLLHGLFVYNDMDDKRYNSVDDMLLQMIENMQNDEMVLPGGIHFASDIGVEIFPSCCCGLEEWKSIVLGLLKGESPWMGHDPFVNHKMEDGLCLITTESELNTYSYEQYDNIYYYEEEFHRLLSKLDKDFQEFVNGPMKEYMEEYSAKYASDFCIAFCHAFGQNK